MNKIIEDKELGRLVITVRPNARRFIFRTKSDGIYVTVPPGTTTKELQTVIDDLREQLIATKQDAPKPKLIDLDYRIDTEYFKLSLVTGNKPDFLASSEQGKMVIVCPPGTQFDDDDLQQWFRKVIRESLRLNAKYWLCARIIELSEQHELPFCNVKVNSSKGRWGSCSGLKDINLSCYTLLLPKHLIDYVLLHELTHTVEMNHSDKFWLLLYQLTDGKVYELREELRGYRAEI